MRGGSLELGSGSRAGDAGRSGATGSRRPLSHLAGDRQQDPEEAGRDHRPETPTCRRGPVPGLSGTGHRRRRRETLDRGEVIGRWLGAAACAFVAACLVWGLRSLIVPIAVGSLLAYVCSPFVERLERYRLTRGFAIALLMLVFLAAGLVLASGIRAGVSSEIGTIDFKTRALFKLNHRYERLMGLDATGDGNRLYQFAHDDLDPVIDRANRLLALTPEERSLFLESHSGSTDGNSRSLMEYDRANLQTMERRGVQAAARSDAARGEARRDSSAAAARARKTPLAALAAILSTWIVAPVVFVFLLRDTGEIKRGFLRLIPNRLFEPTMAVLDDLDRALGGYVRGLFL